MSALVSGNNIPFHTVYTRPHSVDQHPQDDFFKVQKGNIPNMKRKKQPSSVESVSVLTFNSHSHLFLVGRDGAIENR